MKSINTINSAFISFHLRPPFLLLSLMVLFIEVSKYLQVVSAHGLLAFPNPRGSLTNKSRFIFHSVDQNAPMDFRHHYPAGLRDDDIRASGLKSQIVAAGSSGWTEFKPLNTHFRWRAGVCGDMVPPNKQHHLYGGEYYYNGKIVKRYFSGDIIKAHLSIVSHHNGFIEFHLCDISKCRGPDISESCFRVPGACIQLKRAPHSRCDQGYAKDCGPIDRKYQGRWYLPCSKFSDNHILNERFGIRGTIAYKIPDNWACEHCVLQWFWSSAHTCNPPGVIAYYNGPDRPRAWGKCKGQGEAYGGYTVTQPDCSKNRFPEEYLQCADIQVKPKLFSSKTSDSNSNIFTGLTNNDIRKLYKSGKGKIRAIIMVVNEKRYRNLKRYNDLDARGMKSVNLEVLVDDCTHLVTFYIAGKITSYSMGPKYYATGAKLRHWGQIKFDEWMHVSVKSGKEVKHVSFILRN